jgi:DNA-binding IclR family transcriptional regulator
MSNTLKDNRDRSSIQVIARAATILRLLESEKNGLSIGQIAQRVSLPRSTVQRIAAALAEEHLVITAGTNITLGPAILRMAANTNFDFAKFVRPHLEVLAQKTGETVDLSVLSGDQMIFVDQIEADHRLQAVSAVGQNFPAFSSANGKAALSLLDNQSISALLKDGLYRETANTILNLPDLLSQMESIRNTQLASDDEEHTEGISALGTAFFDPLGRIFAVSVPVPTIRFIRSKDAIAAALNHFREELVTSMQSRGVVGMGDENIAPTYKPTAKAG